MTATDASAPREFQLTRGFFFRLFIALFVVALADPASAETPAFAYTSSGTCLVSPEGFKPNLEPKNPGVAWMTTLSASGSTDGTGSGTEIGQFLDSASFGVGPRMHAASAHAYKAAFSSTVTGPEEDGSFSLHVKALQGTFTAGPHDRVTFTISDFELKRQIANKEVTVYESNGSPVIQTITLGNGVTFKRICVLTLSTSARQ